MDHELTRNIFRQLQQSVGQKERDELLKQLREEIIPHMVAEEKALYPMLETEEDERMREDALESREEHHAARLILDSLAAIATTDETFTAKIKVLRDIAEHHMTQEEDHIFQDIRDAFGEEEALDILDSFLEGRETARTSLQSSTESGVWHQKSGHGFARILNPECLNSRLATPDTRIFHLSPIH
jgi:iron-sulfur cluster repair protein YtfE (RIC family)